MRGEQPDPVTAHPLLGQRVGRDLLFADLGEEGVESQTTLPSRPRARPGRTAPRRRRGRGRPTGLSTGRATRRLAQPARPRRAVPDVPEHGLGGGSVGEQPRAAGQQGHQSLGPGRLRASDATAAATGSTSASASSSCRRPRAGGRRRARRGPRGAAAGPAGARRRDRARRAGRPAAPRPRRGAPASAALPRRSRRRRWPSTGRPGAAGRSLAAPAAAPGPPAPTAAAPRRRPPRPARRRRQGVRRSRGMDARPDRTSTAISAHGVGSSRCARRSRSATCSASARRRGERPYLDAAGAVAAAPRSGRAEPGELRAVGQRRHRQPVADRAGGGEDRGTEPP